MADNIPPNDKMPKPVQQNMDLEAFQAASIKKVKGGDNEEKTSNSATTSVVNDPISHVLLTQIIEIVGMNNSIQKNTLSSFGESISGDLTKSSNTLKDVIENQNTIVNSKKTKTEDADNNKSTIDKVDSYIKDMNQTNKNIFMDMAQLFTGGIKQAMSVSSKAKPFFTNPFATLDNIGREKKITKLQDKFGKEKYAQDVKESELKTLNAKRASLTKSKDPEKIKERERISERLEILKQETVEGRKNLTATGKMLSDETSKKLVYGQETKYGRIKDSVGRQALVDKRSKEFEEGLYESKSKKSKLIGEKGKTPSKGVVTGLTGFGNPKELFDYKINISKTPNTFGEYISGIYGLLKDASDEGDVKKKEKKPIETGGGGGGILGGVLSGVGSMLGGILGAGLLAGGGLLARGAAKIGGKVLGKTALKTGAEVAGKTGAKVAGKSAVKLAETQGIKGATKIGGKAIGKSLLKKIPILGAVAGLGFGAERLLHGDFLGAGLEVASGGASLLPGLGTAGSVAIDAGLAARDFKNANKSDSTIAPSNTQTSVNLGLPTDDKTSQELSIIKRNAEIFASAYVSALIRAQSTTEYTDSLKGVRDKQSQSTYKALSTS